MQLTGTKKTEHWTLVGSRGPAAETAAPSRRGPALPTNSRAGGDPRLKSGYPISPIRDPTNRTLMAIIMTSTQ